MAKSAQALEKDKRELESLQPASDAIGETIFYIANTLTIKSPNFRGETAVN
jgi:hypothetical protein